MPTTYTHPRGRRFLAWRAYLLSKPGATERHPFDPGLPVYFVKAKMFALYSGKPEARGIRPRGGG